MNLLRFSLNLVRLWYVLVLVCGVTAAFGQSSRHKRKPQAPETAVLELAKFFHKPLIKAQINGYTGYFLLDTGSDFTVLHDGNARNLDFRVVSFSRKYSIATMSEVVSDGLARAADVELKLGPQPIKTKFYAIDLNTVIESIYQRAHVRILGIIGSDVMRRYGFVIDYTQKLVYYQVDVPAASTVAFDPQQLPTPLAPSILQ
ncbi:Aspartyl protease [Catalinimonas alkaloidigena]|uniref:Aspartyl protease n=1 Tax=Catalinimonas alkaloidigena TaxID=1075417 RepID=A0A1G9RH38_9BACT|nr:aspartyl protease family protein [Catalinimonas alkaloidigena]SDM22558.1 Aspartyl protease [Catalinimonas alkaloidigena]